MDKKLSPKIRRSLVLSWVKGVSIRRQEGRTLQAVFAVGTFAKGKSEVMTLWEFEGR